MMVMTIEYFSGHREPSEEIREESKQQQASVVTIESQNIKRWDSQGQLGLSERDS